MALALTTDAAFATHSASGTLNATLTARRDGSGGPFTASGPLDYGNPTFTSRISDCSYTDAASAAGTWSVTVEPTPTGALKVTWVPGGGGGPRTTATITCRDPGPPPTEFSVPGQPGVTLIQPTPTTFELPSGGGQQAIAGGFQSGGDGFTNSGTLTVTPLRR